MMKNNEKVRWAAFLVLAFSAVLATIATAASAQGANDYLGSYTLDDVEFGTQVTVTVDGTTRTIEANALPDHETGDFPTAGNPNTISAQDKTYSYTTQPAYTGAATSPITIGVAVNGVKFEPGTAETVTCSSGENYRVEALQDIFNLGLDFNNAHVQPTGEYHYHGASQLPATAYETDADLVHVGFAADGYLMYYSKSGAYESGYALSSAARSGSDCVASQALGGGSVAVAGTTPDGTYTSDWSWSDSAGDLDSCNGVEIDGTYAYIITDEYPFISRCLNGEASGGGPGGGGPGGGGPGGGGPGGDGPGGPAVEPTATPAPTPTPTPSPTPSIPAVAGDVATDPGHSVATNTAGQRVLAAITTDGALKIHTSAAGSDWSGGETLGAGAWASADVAIDDYGVVELIAVKQSGALYTRSLDATGSWGSWTSHGYANWDVDTSPSIATNGADVALAAVKADGRLYTRASIAGSWGDFAVHGLATWAHVDLDLSADGELWIVGTKVDGRLYTRSHAGSWSSWSSHGYPTWSASTPPAIAATSDGATLIAVKADGRLYTRTVVGTEWTDFVQHGLSAWASADVASNDLGETWIIAAKADGRLFTRSYSTSWGSWASHGLATWSSDADPSISVGASEVNLVAVKTDGRLYTRTYGSTWEDFTAHNGTIWAS